MASDTALLTTSFGRRGRCRDPAPWCMVTQVVIIAMGESVARHQTVSIISLIRLLRLFRVASIIKVWMDRDI